MIALLPNVEGVLGGQVQDAAQVDVVHDSLVRKLGVRRGGIPISPLLFIHIICPLV